MPITTDIGKLTGITVHVSKLYNIDSLVNEINHQSLGVEDPWVRI
jgi:hypothetical protein